MATLDEIFYKEFKKMMNDRKAHYGSMNLSDIPIPPSLKNEMYVENRDIVAISAIDDPYYGKLGNSYCLLWGRGKLMRRKFDHKGEYMLNPDGSNIWMDVTCPQDCVAIISDKSIGVPTSYKPSEPFEYVEMIQKEVDEKKQTKFIYIVPRKYCYKCNQTALVLSWTRLRSYYSGVALSLESGHTLYVHIVPYKPRRNVSVNYRILMSRVSIDYNDVLEKLRDYWIGNRVMFNPAHCALDDNVHGVTNMAMQILNGVLDEYQVFDINKPLGEIDSVEDEQDEYQLEV